MNNKKQQTGSRPRPVWVDNWLIRERVARWRTRDRVKDWVRRLPRRVAYWVVVLYASLSSIVFAGLIWWAVKHPYVTIIDGPEAGVAMRLHPPTVKPNRDVQDLQWFLTTLRSDSVRRRAFEDYLQRNPEMADSLKALQKIYPALQF
jgi:hypothetical protein